MTVRWRRLGFYAVPLTAALLSINPAAAQSRQTQVQQQWNMRYAEMDANDDGVITRSEWRGTRQAFDAADWSTMILARNSCRSGGALPPLFKGR